VLSGTVLQGQFEGRNLEELSFDDLLELLRECRVNDPQSATVLETYLDRVHGADWRGAGGEGAAGGDGAGSAAGSGGSMTRDQAYEVLGLATGATEAEIRDAHRKLLMANHPDKGGSTFLAAQINQAKDVLLPGS
jgi:DnaJ-domain-containing protein 1